MIITRVARVALRRQAITTTVIARPTPAYARSLSFFDLFRPRRVESTETKETETKTTETEAAKTKTSDTQATETQPVKKPPFDTVPVETPSIEDQLNKDEPAKDQAVEEEPNEEFKEKFKGRRGQGKSQKTQPADQPKQKGSYKSRHSSKWIHIITKRIRLLQERQRTKKDIPHSLWREIGRVNASVNQNWSRVYASSEGFLTPKEGVAGLTKQEVAWGDMDNMGHVNNVMYNKYAEASRVNWIRGLAEYRKDNTEEEVQQYLQLMTPESVGLILRSIRTHFKFPVKFPDRVSVFHKINKPPEPGSDHFILEAIILSEYNCRVAARCTEDIVIYDYQEGKKSTLRPNQVRDLNRIYKRQPLNRETADKEIDAWMDRLTDIEMQLQNTPTPKSSRPSQGAESLGRVEGLRLKDIPLKHEDVVESAIDEALRTTGELEAEVNEESEISKEDTRDAEASEDLEIPNNLEASKDVETSEGTEANKDLEVPKDAETSNDAAVPEGTKDAVSEFTEESKESKNPDAFKNAEVLEGTKESKESKDSETSKDMAPESPKESKESQDAPKV